MTKPPAETTPADPDLARLVTAWPALPAPIRRAMLALVDAATPSPADFAPAFDRAFDQLDRQAGSHNFISLVDLRRAVALDRAAFDAQLHRLRMAGRYTLSAAEGRHGLTAAEREASILEDGTLLLYVSRR